jgi:hypothetical protein
MAEEHLFWSDDFDMDLPKIFPDALNLLGDLADTKLVTFGTPDRNGRLNHPAVWNGDATVLSFFGFAEPPLRRAGLFYKPEFYSAGEGEVICTAWEAFRDAWPHHYLLTIERRPIWDTFPLQREFEAIMWDVRGWGGPGFASENADVVKRSKRRVMNSYCEAIRAFGRLVDEQTAGARAHG